MNCLQVNMAYRHTHPFLFQRAKGVLLINREQNMCHRNGGSLLIMISDLV